MDDKEFDLNAYFDAERAAGVTPSADFLGRVLQDAKVVQKLPAISVTAPQQGLFANLVAAIGGWPTLAGMATAGIVGIWLGFSQPAGIDRVAEQIWGASDAGYLVDLAPEFADEFEEG